MSQKVVKLHPGAIPKSANEIDPQVAQKLFEKVSSTAQIRFIAANRIRNSVGRTTQLIAWYSCFAILISVLSALGHNILGRSDLTSALLVFSSTVILAASLIFGSSSTTESGVRMHFCAKRLRALGLEIEYHRHSGELRIKRGLYVSLSKKYEQILDGQENHSKNDYYENLLQERQKMLRDMDLRFKKKFFSSLRTLWDFWAHYLSKVWTFGLFWFFLLLPVCLLSLVLLKSLR